MGISVDYVNEIDFVKMGYGVSMKVYEIGIFDIHEGGGQSRLFNHGVSLEQAKDYLIKLLSVNLPQITDEELEKEPEDMREMVMNFRREVKENSDKVNLAKTLQELHGIELTGYFGICVIEREVH